MNDIALMELDPDPGSGPVLSNAISSICVSPAVDGVFRDGMQCVITGWGAQIVGG